MTTSRVDLLPSDRWALTPRSLLIGSLSALSIALILPYTINVIHGSRIGLSSCTPAAFILFFTLILTLQIVLGLLKRDWLLRPGELAVIFIMMAMATVVPNRGIAQKVVSMVTGVTFYTTPENNWAELIQPILAEWLVLGDQQAVRDLYFGGGVEQIPWHLWMPVLLRWFLFFIAYYLTLFSALVILRRQWVEHERLAFPLAQLPLAMLQDDGRPDAIVRPFFRDKVMWAGFLFSFLINSTNVLHNYFSFIPAVMGVVETMIFRDQIELMFRINFLMLGFAYFINTTVAFSMWFFYLVRVLQGGAFAIFGIGLSQHLGPGDASGPVGGAAIGHQMMGALIVLVVFGLWTARPHLAEVLRKAWNSKTPVDDSQEIMSYRTAVLCFLGGSGFIFVWLWQSGMPAWTALLFIFAAFVLMIGLARVVAETGLPTVAPAMAPATFLMSGIGSTALGIKGVVALGYTLVWVGGFLMFVTAPMANALRIGSEITRNRRGVFLAVGRGRGDRHISGDVVSDLPRLQVWRLAPQLQVLPGFCHVAVAVCGGRNGEPHRAERGRVDMDRGRGCLDGRAHACAPRFRLVAVPPHRICRQCFLGDEPSVDVDHGRLVDQGYGAQLWRGQPLRTNEAVFHGDHSGAVRGSGILAAGGFLHGSEVQSYPGVLILRCPSARW